MHTIYQHLMIGDMYLDRIADYDNCMILLDAGLSEPLRLPITWCRFKHLPIVKENLVRFYAGTPIVSSRGHRLGTVCFASDKPRKFDAEGCMMLTNMGELVTRELEREWAAQQAAKSLDSSQSVSRLSLSPM